MELSQEVYAWLVNSGMIDSKKTIKMKKNNNIILDELTTTKFRDAQIQKLIHKLEDQYNRFYKTKMTYTDRLHDMKTENISSNSVRFWNWKLVADILNNFGLDANDDVVGQIVAGHLEDITKLVEQMYTLSGELSKRSMTEQVEEDKAPAKKVHVAHNQGNDVIELNHINENKNLNDADTLLEYFLISLCKPFNIKIRQAAGLLANNRKYLIQVANKGLKGNFSRLLAWYTSISFSSKHLFNLVRSSKQDAKTMCYATISCGLYSKDSQVASSAISIINQTFAEIGPDYEWFFKEGINGYLYCSTTHSELIPSCFNSMETFSKTRINDIANQIRKMYNADREGLFDIIDSIIDKIKKCNVLIYEAMRTMIFDFLLNENKDRCRALSVMCDAWITFYPDVDESTSVNILNFLNKCLKDTSQHNTLMTALFQGFRVMNFLGKNKDDNAPKILKQMVFKLIEHYNDTDFKESCLKQFLNSFQLDHNIPIDIMLKPYLKQIKSTDKYCSIDFSFLDKIIKHPRFNTEMFSEILEFYFSVCLNNQYYYKVSHNRINEYVDKGYLHEDHYETCCRFIKSSIKAYLKKGDLYLLDTSYDLINLNVPAINKKMEKDVVEANKYYRIENGDFSIGLLALLWYYDCHDDVILQMEEKFSKRYDPIIRTVTEISIVHSVHNPQDHIEKIKRKKELEKKQKQQQLEKEMTKKKKIEEHMKLKLHERALELGKTTIIVPEKIKVEKDRMIAPIMNSKLFHASSIILSSGNPLIKPEGSVIDIFRGHDIKEDFTKFDLDKEENREKVAVDTLIKENKKKLNYFYNAYITELNKEINKQNLLKMFRDVGISDNLLSLEELNNTIRSNFDHPLTVFNFDQFIELIVLLSNIAFSKMSRGASVCQHLQSFLDLLIIPKTSETNKTNQFIKDLLNKKLDNGKEVKDLTLPPGFKPINKIKLNFDYSINKEFIHKFLPESKIVVIDLLDEIISSSLGGNHIIEPFVKPKAVSEIIVTEKAPKWPKSIFKGCINTNKDLQNYVGEVGELMNEMLKAIEIGRTTLSHVKPPTFLEKAYYDEMHSFIKEKNDKDKKRKLRRQFLKEKLNSMKEDIENKKKAEKEEKERAKKQQNDKLRTMLLKEKEEKNKIKQDLEKKRQERKEVEVTKIREQRQKEEEDQKKLKQVEEVFLKKQKKKLKDQFEKLKQTRTKMEEEMYEEMALRLKSVDVEKVFEKKKDYYDFSKNLNNNISNVMEKPEIKEVFETHDSHLKSIFQIYCQVGNRKLHNIHHYENAIHQKDLNEFCSDFLILGLLLTTEQILTIFRKVAKRNIGEYEDRFFLKYEDFKLVLLYMVLYSKLVPKGHIDFDKSLLEKITADKVQSFFDFMGLKLPYSRVDIEDFINDRRALTHKQKFNYQNEFRKKMLHNFVEAKPLPRKKRIASSAKNINNANNKDKDDNIITLKQNKTNTTSMNNIKKTDNRDNSKKDSKSKLTKISKDNSKEIKDENNKTKNSNLSKDKIKEESKSAKSSNTDIKKVNTKGKDQKDQKSNKEAKGKEDKSVKKDDKSVANKSTIKVKNPSGKTENYEIQK